MSLPLYLENLPQFLWMLTLKSYSKVCLIFCGPQEFFLLSKSERNKTRNKTTMWPAIPLLGIYSEETKIEKDTCTPIFIAALFTIAKTWKQPRCPLTDEWIKKLWYIYTMKYCSSIKRNAFESVLMRWMNLEPIMQSEVSQKEKDEYHILTHIYRI